MLEKIKELERVALRRRDSLTSNTEAWHAWNNMATELSNLRDMLPGAVSTEMVVRLTLTPPDETDYESWASFFRKVTADG